MSHSVNTISQSQSSDIEIPNIKQRYEPVVAVLACRLGWSCAIVVREGEKWNAEQYP